MGFFSQLEQYASSHNRGAANAPQFEGKEHKHCTVRGFRIQPGDLSKATVAGEAGEGKSYAQPGGLAGDRRTLRPSTPVAGALVTTASRGV